MTAYALGVDLGTTSSAAVVARGADARPVALGTDQAAMPSVVVIEQTGEVLVGDAAERRAGSAPLRTVREFKRRLGDPVPVMVGGTAYPVESLMAHLLRDIVARATAQEGEPPSLVVLTHPANYYGYKIATLREAARLAGLDPQRVLLLTEPEAAAIAHSRTQRVEPGDVVAIYDFGGGTFDAAVLRRTADRFELVGAPEGMERLGGIDIDQAVLAHVDDHLDGTISAADPTDPATIAAVWSLRAECRRAKEALSSSHEASITVAVHGRPTQVRLTRGELESMVRPRVDETVRSLQRAIASADVPMAQVSRVLLVGGSSRMPLVAEAIGATTGRPVVLDTHPKMAIATGAALVGAASLAPAAVPPPPSAPATPPAGDVGAWQPPVPSAATAPGAAPAPAPFRTLAPVDPAPPRRARWAVLALAAFAAGAVAVAAVATLGGDDDTDTSAASAVTDDSTGDSTGAATPVAAGVQVTPIAFGAAAPGAGIPGPALSAGVSGVVDLAVDPSGALLVLTPEGTVLRVADGTVALLAQLDVSGGPPGGIAVAPDGTVAVTLTTGAVSVTADGAAPLLDAATAGLGPIAGPLAFDRAGNLYLTDDANHRIVRRGIDGALTLVAGNGLVPDSGVAAGDGSLAGTIAIGTIRGLDIDAGGDVVFVDATAVAVRLIAPDGTVSTRATGESVDSAGGLAVDATGAVYVSNRTTGAIVRLRADGATDTLVTRSPGAVGAIAVDADGSLLLVDGTSIARLTAF
jgi:actin-like ATPase involved in cell morphogenesis/sugar lactone lactonase YvrE